MPFPNPILPIMVMWLLLDRLGAAGWIWGFVGFFFALWILIWVLSIYHTDEIDLFEISNGDEETIDKPKIKSKFQERLDEAMRKAKE